MELLKEVASALFFFLIMINDIKLSNMNVHLSLFAVDIAIWLETKM